MAWIESHQELARHPKTLRLARLLGVSVPAAIGHLQLLWWWAMDFAQDGSLDEFDAEEIAQAMLWDGDPDTLWSGLVGARFVDTNEAGGASIHDWDDYAGRLIEKRRADAERKRMSRGRPSDVTPPSGVTVPNRTGPDSTQPDRNLPPNPPPQAEGGSAAGAAGKKRRRGRRNGSTDDEPTAGPLEAPELTPVDAGDRDVWNLARAAASAGLSNGNAEALGLLEPIGRAPDGGLHLRAPPGLGLARFTNHVARALLDAGDQAASRVAIVEGRPGERKG